MSVGSQDVKGSDFPTIDSGFDGAFLFDCMVGVITASCC